ncbi:hypothetical protein B0H13DRAFT_1906036 [Mycena leptocephala]|nr:hypothetical protein B0H13DRAFT_1906036 [Mycena leptocephala]
MGVDAAVSLLFRVSVTFATSSLPPTVEGGDGPLVDFPLPPISSLSVRYIGHQADYLFPPNSVLRHHLPRAVRRHVAHPAASSRVNPATPTSPTLWDRPQWQELCAEGERALTLHTAGDVRIVFQPCKLKLNVELKLRVELEFHKGGGGIGYPYRQVRRMSVQVREIKTKRTKPRQKSWRAPETLQDDVQCVPNPCLTLTPYNVLLTLTGAMEELQFSPLFWDGCSEAQRRQLAHGGSAPAVHVKSSLAFPTDSSFSSIMVAPSINLMDFGHPRPLLPPDLLPGAPQPDSLSAPDTRDSVPFSLPQSPQQMSTHDLACGLVQLNIQFQYRSHGRYPCWRQHIERDCTGNDRGVAETASSELLAAAATVSQDGSDVAGARRVSARKRAQADSAGAAPVSSNKRQNKLEDSLAGRYPEEFAQRYKKDHQRYLDYFAQ